ncbi:MAG: carbonic anhydrase family protein [Betaproteobacteria bacterium]|nr:carbonic anhydrase family protein [Betaproteobacteria bacterium]
MNTKKVHKPVKPLTIDGQDAEIAGFVMVRLIIEFILAVVLAVAITLAAVWGSEAKRQRKEISTYTTALKAAEEKIEALETQNEELQEKVKHAAHAAPHWGYAGEMNPAKWGEAFPTCGTGKAQAPLDIKGPFEKSDVTLKVDYKMGPLKVLNNGHTIQVNVDPGSKLIAGDKSYNLLQFHFHRPSEELIDGKPAAMVAHFVHKSDEGNLAVIGVLINEGKENALLKQIWKHAPTKEGPEVTVPDARIDPKSLMPLKMNFYSYEGSLTTPPCTEGVRFFILKTPATLTKEQVEQFPFKLNARPVQPQNGRKITEG